MHKFCGWSERLIPVEEGVSFSATFGSTVTLGSLNPFKAGHFLQRYKNDND